MVLICKMINPFSKKNSIQSSHVSRISKTCLERGMNLFLMDQSASPRWRGPLRPIPNQKEVYYHRVDLEDERNKTNEDEPAPNESKGAF